MDWEIIIEAAVRLVFSAVAAVLGAYVAPWLREKRIYGVVSAAVRAAEKWAETHEIDKKAWVVERLQTAGIKLSPTVDSMIEAAVLELDRLLGK